MEDGKEEDEDDNDMNYTECILHYIRILLSF